MNDATNDATEFESTLDGAIGFFQNLRRKLSVLEQDASIQHDQMHAIAASVATLDQDHQSDRQTLAALAGNLDTQATQLTELRADGCLLDRQLGQIETLIADFQLNHEQLREQLATLASDLQAQTADLRQELATSLEQRAAPEDQIAALEIQGAEQARSLQSLLASVQSLNQDTRIIRDHADDHQSRLEQHQGLIDRLQTAVQAGQEQLGQFSGIAETQHQHLHQLESALGAIDQNTRNLGQLVDGLKTTTDRHDHTLDTLRQTVESHETARHQWGEQQTRLDGFADILDARWRESQTLQESLAQLRDELDAQRLALSEASQTRQDLQRQQDRLKHLETLIGKVSADTNSTRQILNILQSDLTTQSDTLRELDEHWQSILATSQPPTPPLETPAASADVPATAPVESAGSPVAPPVSAPDTAFDKPLAALAIESQRLERELHQVLSDVQNGLVGQDERFTELRSALQDQLNIQRERLDRFETVLEQLRANPTAAPDLNQQELELQRTLAPLQHAMTALEERLNSQAQAFSGNFDQFRVLASDIHNLQQQISALESLPLRLSALEEDLIERAQGITQLQDTVRQFQEDSQQLGKASQPTNAGARVEELEARLTAQDQQYVQLAEAIDAIGVDAKATQEQVITMATNVAKRIFEFQNQLTATEAAHAERLREAEQKLIQLQAALEIMETQRKGRRWFSMPAMFTHHFLLTVGAAFLGVMATVIWTTT